MYHKNWVCAKLFFGLCIQVVLWWYAHLCSEYVRIVNLCTGPVCMSV